MIIAFLVYLLIAAVIIYALYVILGMINLPPAIKTLVYLIVGIVLILWVLNFFGIYHTNVINLPRQ